MADQKPVTHMVGQYSKTLYPSPLPMTPGEEMGGFKLGSTVILLFEAPEDFEFTVKPGETVRMGQAFGGRSKA